MKRLLGLTLLVFLLSTAFVTAQGNADTLSLATFLDTGNLNPMLTTTLYNGVFAWSNIFDIDGQTGVPIPGLSSWEVSDDGLTYTFTIREDAMWSDGTPITTADVEFTLNAINSDLVTTTLKSLIPPAAFNNFTVIDDRTFSITLDAVDCTFLNKFFGLTPVPSKAFAPDFSDVMDNALNTEGGLSSGPYVLTEYVPDEFMRFEANPYYWGGEPKIKNIVVRFMGDPATSNLALQSGEIDYLRMTAAQFDQLGSADQFNVYTVPNQFITGLLWNHADPENPMAALDADGNPVEQPPHPVLGDVRVRRAIAMGYDKAAILSSIGDENSGMLVNGSAVHPALEAWAYNADQEPWPYDPEAAAALLDEAGWTDQDGNGIRECHGCATAEEGTPLSFEITYSPIYAEYDNVALVVQDQLTALGIEVIVSSIEYGSLITDFLLPQKFDVTVLSFGGFPADPDGLADAIMTRHADNPGSGFNIASYANDRLEELVVAGRSVPGCAPEERAPIYHEIQQITKDDVIYDFAFVTNDYLVVSKRISGFIPAPAGGEGGEFWNIEDWTLEG